LNNGRFQLLAARYPVAARQVACGAGAREACNVPRRSVWPFDAAGGIENLVWVHAGAHLEY
jgi:hypothetical protein